MKLKEQFKEACTIAKPLLEQGYYRWLPHTTAGWMIRIACTDVGQGAWGVAKERLSTVADRPQSPQDEVVQMPSEKD